MRSRRLRQSGRSKSSLLGRLREKNQRRDSRRKIRSLLTVENLEQRHLLAALVGVDFDGGSNGPENWASIGTQSTVPGFTQSDLLDEDGNETGYDLTISGAGGAITEAAAVVNESTLPIHSRSLSGIDGQIFTDAEPVTLVWSDLKADTSYEVYVFGLEGFWEIPIQQDVTITGSGSPVTFRQEFDKQDLFINDAIGSSTVPLSAYAKVVAADANRQITIQIDPVTLQSTPAGLTEDVSLGGVAIREVSGSELTITLGASSISEAAGAGATTATVSVNAAPTSDLVVNLSSDDTGEATVPTTVTIPANTNISLPFNINAIDDAIVDGTQTVTITATAAGLIGGTASLDVTDDDATALTVAIAAAAIAEGDGPAATTATVSRNGDTSSALNVNLLSSNTNEATVTGSVTIPAGQATSAPFAINAVNDLLDDSTQTVTITATAGGYLDGTDSLEVVDDDVAANLGVVIAAASVSESAGSAATTATVTRSTGLIINRVDRGAGISDGVDGTQSNSSTTGGSFTANYRNENPDATAEFHTVEQNSSIDALGIDGTGIVTVEDEFGFFAPVDDASYFDVYFDLLTPHTFTLTGHVSADSDAIDIEATLDLRGPGTQLSFREASNAVEVGGQTDINQSGILAPGTYHFVARATASSTGTDALGEADFAFDLQLQPAALDVTLSSNDTSEANVPATVTIAAGQATSPAFNIDAVDDAIVDGTQTVTIVAARRRTATAMTRWTSSMTRSVR